MANAIMRTYLQTVVNVSAATSRLINDKGMDDFDELDDFSEDDMRTLCTNIRRPGGSITNPRVAVRGQPPIIRDPRNVISMVAEERLILTAYAAMHQTRTSSPINAQTMTRTFIMSLVPLREQKLVYKDLVSIANPLKDATVAKWLEGLDEYLMILRGVNKCPLSYVKRNLVAVTVHANDPSIGYANIDEGMTAHAPHDQYVYGADNKALWHILHVALKSTEPLFRGLGIKMGILFSHANSNDYCFYILLLITFHLLT